MFKDYPAELFNSKAASRVLPVVLEHIQPKSVLDIGCGNGSWLYQFQKLGIADISGVDSPYIDGIDLLVDREKIIKKDLGKPFDLGKRFDLVISLEVAEHLPKESEDAFIENIVRHADTVVFSAALPHQGGQDHLNEQYPSYWAEKFAKHGYHFFDCIRKDLWNDSEIFFWYRQNIFFVANDKSTLFNSGDISSPFDAVHPVLFEREAKLAIALREGDLGIEIAWRSLWKALKKRFMKR
ncbi:class I SAM-dependent methyltransferase [uncultured Imperialibacter sp.]|uniref:class I SAM-dependent methyltransferase n=1 Tax=uncultured Imperialibacter sp. TaxID=1672639 RepID=UPI0030DBC1D9|tara:strand:- start:14020 stop:14736 length:717 start_codon:yes stop_codon:yes gene_type:complete